MDSSTELIVKNGDRFEGKSLLVIGCPGYSDVLTLSAELRTRPLKFLHRDFSVYSQVLKTSDADILQHSCGVWLDTPLEATDAVLLYMPKGKELLELTLSAIATIPSARLYLVGAKRSGIESADKILKRTFDNCRKVDSARHAILLTAALKSEAVGSFNPDDFLKKWSIDLRSGSLQIASLPGVFSHGRLDDGTARLLKCLNRSPGERVLDFGCGCGIIGSAIARENPQTEVEMIDNDALAIASSQATVNLNDLARVRCYPSDLFTEVSSRFDLIVSNPTFHQGNATDRRMVTQLIEESPRYLKPGGRLVIVANRFLPYGSLLSKQYSIVRTLSEDSRYLVYLAKRPKDLT